MKLPKSHTETKLNDCWSKMPLDAPLHIRCPNKMFIYGLILFKIGGNASWSGRINKIVEIANEMTPIKHGKWTYAKVDYALRWLRKEGWLYAERPARNKALVYRSSRPTDVLPMETGLEKALASPVIEPEQKAPNKVHSSQSYSPGSMAMRNDPEALQRMIDYDMFVYGAIQPETEKEMLCRS